MKVEIRKYISAIVANRKLSIGLVLFAVGALTLTMSWDRLFGGMGTVLGAETGNTPLVKVAATMPEVATVGDGIEGVDSPGTSWSGEILSLGNVSIQPQREGALVEWKVRIGDRVKKGQVLATLSAPPLMPDITNMLAEKAEMFSRTRASAEVTKNFSQKNNQQLANLLNSIGNTSQESQDILSGNSPSLPTASSALNQARKTAETMQQNVRAFLDQVVVSHLQIVSHATAVSTFRSSSFNPWYGMIDLQNQNDYQVALIKLINALRDPNAVPFKEAEHYFPLAIRLFDTTIESSETEDLVDNRKMVRADQNEYLEMVADYREAEADVAMKETEYKLMSVEQTRMYAQDRKMIDEKIAENEKMTAMSQAEAKAAEAAYGKIVQGLTGGLNITAPRAGTISTIMTKVGQFVEPGMPIATLDSGDPSERFVRFRIPGNIRLPQAGMELTMMRPGFPQDVKKIKLLGVGTTLESGTFMADAVFLEPVDWPSDASVRVSTSQSSSTPVIKYSSIWWNEAGKSFVWAVSDADRIFAKKITIGRTFGALIEVYEGLKNGDRYVASHEPSIYENMLLEDLMPRENNTNQPATSGGDDSMGGMEM